MKKAMVISCFGWYERRIKPVCNVLKKEYEIQIFIGDFIHSTKERVKEKNENCKYIHVKSYKKNISIYRLFSHLNFSYHIKNVIEKERPDLLYVLMPPNSVGDVCRKYRIKHKESKLILDLIDMWPESMPLGNFIYSFPAQLWKRMRDESLQTADFVFTECKLYAELLQDIIKDKTLPLYLLKYQSDEEKKLVINKVNKIKNIEEKIDITIAYVGSINNIIDIDCIIKVLKLLAREYSVTVRIIGDGENRKYFVSALNEFDIIVEFFGKIFDERKKIDILAGCDIALNIMKPSVNVGLTIKSIDYFSYGLPIINTIRGDTWELIEKYNIGYNVSVIEENLLKYIRKLKREDHLHVMEVYEKIFSEEAFTMQIEKCMKKIDSEEQKW